MQTQPRPVASRLQRPIPMRGIASWPRLTMKIIRAAHLGMCFGVRDAIDLALQQDPADPVTVLGDLVHNEVVLAELKARGIRFETDLSLVATSRVMITAHG